MLRWPLLLAVLEPVALAVHLQDVNVVGEPIQQGSGQPLGPERLGPFVERQVAGDQSGTAFVTPAEEIGRASCRERV